MHKSLHLLRVYSLLGKKNHIRNTTKLYMYVHDEGILFTKGQTREIL